MVSLHSVEDSSVDAFDFQTSGNTILRGFHMWKDNRLFPGAAVRMKGRKYNTAVNNALKYNFCSGANVTFWKSSFGRSVSSSYVRQIPALIFLGLKC